MKFDFKLNKDTFSNLLKKKGSSDRALFHPTRDWLYVLGVAAAIGVGSIAYHVTVFLSANAEHHPAPTILAAPPEIDRAKLTGTLAKIKARNAQFGSSASSTVILPDPSR